MKKLSLLLVILTAAAIMPGKIAAQSDEIQQLILNYEKLAQLKGILQNMKKGYDILNKGYNTVKDISGGNFNLHDAFLKNLLAVNPAIKNYKRVADIIRSQTRIVQEYKTAYNGFRKSKYFSPDELDYLSTVYGNLLNKSLEQIDELVMIVTASKLRMSDAERLAAIDRVYGNMEDKLMFLRGFNSRTQQLASGRAKLERDNYHTGKAYGLNN